MKIEIEIERPKEEDCYSYWDTAKQIAKLPRDENWELNAANLIKLHGHQQKYSAYRRIKEFGMDFVDIKVKTHEKILKEWHSGKWKATK